MSVELKQRYTFSKDEKLKSRKAIEQLFATGRSFSNFPFKVVWKGTENTVTGSQAGFTVSSKQFKKAVDRNFGPSIIQTFVLFNETV